MLSFQVPFRPDEVHSSGWKLVFLQTNVLFQRIPSFYKTRQIEYIKLAVLVVSYLFCSLQFSGDKDYALFNDIIDKMYVQTIFLQFFILDTWEKFCYVGVSNVISDVVSSCTESLQFLIEACYCVSPLWRGGESPIWGLWQGYKHTCLHNMELSLLYCHTPSGYCIVIHEQNKEWS